MYLCETFHSWRLSGDWVRPYATTERLHLNYTNNATLNLYREVRAGSPESCDIFKLDHDTTTSTIDVEFIEPASYVHTTHIEYVYLSDPIGEGDQRVGKIVKCPYSGMFYMQWDYVPITDPLTNESIRLHIQNANVTFNRNVKTWWHHYHTPDEDS